MKPTVGNAGISLRQRLLMLTLLTSGISVLVGCGAILIFDLLFSVTSITSKK